MSQAREQKVSNKQWAANANEAEKSLLALADIQNIPDYIFVGDHSSRKKRKDYQNLVQEIAEALAVHDQEFGLIALHNGWVTLETISKEMQFIFESDQIESEKTKTLNYIRLLSSEYGYQALQDNLIKFNFENKSLARFLTSKGIVILQLINRDNLNVNDTELVDTEPMQELLSHAEVIEALRNGIYDLKILAELNTDYLPYLGTPEAIQTFAAAEEKEVKENKENIKNKLFHLSDVKNIDLSIFKLIFQKEVLQQLLENKALYYLPQLAQLNIDYVKSITSRQCLPFVAKFPFFSITTLSQINNPNKIIFIALNAHALKIDNLKLSNDSIRNIIPIIQMYKNHEVLNFVLSNSNLMQYIHEGKISHKNFASIPTIYIAKNTITQKHIEQLIKESKLDSKLDDDTQNTIYGYLDFPEKAKHSRLSRKHRIKFLDNESKNIEEYKTANMLIYQHYKLNKNIDYNRYKAVDTANDYYHYFKKFFSGLLNSRESYFPQLINIFQEQMKSLLNPHNDSEESSESKKSKNILEKLCQPKTFEFYEKFLELKLGKNWRTDKLDYNRLNLYSNDELIGIINISNTILSGWLDSPEKMKNILKLATSFSLIPLDQIDSFNFILKHFKNNIENEEYFRAIQYLARSHNLLAKAIYANVTNAKAMQDFKNFIQRPECYIYFKDLPEKFAERKYWGVKYVFYEENLLSILNVIIRPKLLEGIFQHRYKFSDFNKFTPEEMNILFNPEIIDSLTSGQISLSSLYKNLTLLKQLVEKEEKLDPKYLIKLNAAADSVELANNGIRKYINTPAEERLSFLKRQFGNPEFGTDRARNFLCYLNANIKNCLYQAFFIYAILNNTDVNTLNDFVLHELNQNLQNKNKKIDLSKAKQIFAEDLADILKISKDIKSIQKEFAPFVDRFNKSLNKYDETKMKEIWNEFIDTYNPNKNIIKTSSPKGHTGK